MAEPKVSISFTYKTGSYHEFMASHLAIRMQPNYWQPIAFAQTRAKRNRPGAFLDTL